MIKVGIVGLGTHSLRAHVQHLKKYDDVEIIGGFDPSDNAFSNFSVECPKAVRYKTYEDMILDKQIDAILISSPDKFHLPQMEKAIMAGKHVFCEKPLCTNMSDFQKLKDIFEIADDKNLVISSCHPRRYDPPYLWVKEKLPFLIETYGKVIELKLDFMYAKPEQSKIGMHGGSLLQDHMNHEFDYLNFLFGLDSCQSMILTDSETEYRVCGIRDDEISFNFCGTRNLESKTYAETIDIRFEKGLIHVDTYNSGKSFIEDHETQKRINGLSLGKTDYEMRFDKINRNWIDTINDKQNNYLNSREMLANTFMSIAFKEQKIVQFSKNDFSENHAIKL